ncbi:hypothetical protein [Arthrobacter sp. efr-133-TYG-118]|uniref:hypothetical protein n=1 Tax=Arthrobacter sp. efr-133-TYG-118 TaxID=3040279 RepID=UPI002551BDEF|nr:hypothetical protein [Arthrobacter sp. efr-133-TYG-118]
MSISDHDQPQSERTQDNGDKMRQGANQLVDGAGKVAVGAKDYLDAHVAPAVKNAARTARERIDAKTREAGGPLALARRYGPQAIPIAALVAIMGLYLPIASFHGYGLSYMDAGSDGKILLVLAILTIIAAVLNLTVKSGNTSLRLAAGIGAGCVGLGALLDGFGNLFAIGPSFGSFFLGLAGFALVAAGVLTLFNKPGQHTDASE